ncbi:MAG TPA: trigger factor [Acidimicrobiales bacterium]|nr:trigger factor [Acidimicrobiales bacterium]
MKATVETLEGNKVKVSVEVDETEFESAVDDAFRRIAREVRIPGFRPGKAPRRVLEAQLGTGFAREEALRHALPEYYAQAVRENDVDVIAPPEIDITGGEEDGPVVFDAVVEIRPEIAIRGHDDLTVTIPSPLVSDEEVDAQVERLRQNFAELATVDRAAQDGDNVTIDIAGWEHDEPVSGLTADDYLYEVGAGAVVAEIDDQLRGAKVGDILEFDAGHPDPDSEASLRIRIMVKEIKEKVLPEVDDEWANEASEFETVEALREDLRKRSAMTRVIMAQMGLRNGAAQAAGDLVDADDVPEAMVSAEMEHRLQDLAMRLQAQGMDFDSYMAASGQDQEGMVAELRDAAVMATKADLALRGIAEAEGLDATEEDLDEELEKLAERVEQSSAEVRLALEEGDQIPAVRSDLRKRKALDWLVEHVQIVDEDGTPVDRADLEAPEVEEPEDDQSEAEIEIEAAVEADENLEEQG